MAGTPRRVALLPAAALTAAVLAVASLSACSGEPESKCAVSAAGVIECAPGDRAAAPDLRGELLDGSPYDLATARGDVVVVNFWASWCNPCRAEADDLEGTYLTTKDSGVRFLGINTGDQRDKAVAFEVGRATYPSLFDAPGRAALDFDVPPNALPATIVLDREGRIAAVIRRATVRSELEPLVARLAAEKS